MRTILTLGLLTALTTGAHAQAPQVDRLEVNEYGIYATTVESSKRDANGVLQSSVSKVRHVETTRDIPAQLGTSFGFNFTLVGKPDEAPVKLRKFTIFPRELTPDTGKPISRSEIVITALVGRPQYTSYKFDDPWELAPGTWTIELWSGDTKLVTQSFTVFKPAPAGKSK